jgi:hypothetical protein
MSWFLMDVDELGRGGCRSRRDSPGSRCHPADQKEEIMSTPPEPASTRPFDPNHPAVGGTQAWLNTGRHTGGPQGDLLIMTVRVPNATVTAIMSKQDAQKWIDQLQSEVDAMSSLLTVPAGVPLPPMNGRQHPGM